MFSMNCAIIDSITKFFSNFTNLIGLDVLFFISLAVEILIVIFFIVKSIFSYEASLNRSLEKINYWLFEKKYVTEENIKDLNLLFKTKTPKRLCYYWQQYILFREGAPSSYMSADNLIEKPLKTSSYNSNIKNLSLFTTIWAAVVAMFTLVATGYKSGGILNGETVVKTLFVPILVGLIGVIFVVYLRARKNSSLNSLYQNVQLFGRFMDNACVDLPAYIDYQLLFTPQEIEAGQPVLREFLDYKARKEKEEFNRTKEDEYNLENYDFNSTGVDGSIMLDRAMKESEIYIKKKEKFIVQISQLEAALDSRKKNFDAVQKDYQAKIQTSKENIDRFRQLQEETTNRIESNYYRKQQSSEIGKQEQLEQELEQRRVKYMAEKADLEKEIADINVELDKSKKYVEYAMMSEYQTFFNKFCQSAEAVVTRTFNDRFTKMQNEIEQDRQYITELEVKLKNLPQGESEGTESTSNGEGKYDENGNYVYPNGTYYDKDGNFHDEKGKVYSQDGKLLSQPEPEQEEVKEVNFDDFDPFDFMTDTTQKGDVYNVAENVVKNVDENMKVVNNSQPNNPLEGFSVEDFEPQTEDKAEEPQEKPEEKAGEKEPEFNFVELEPAEEPQEEKKVEEQPKKEEKPAEQKPRKKAGRPRKIVTEQPKQAKPRGRPKKVVDEDTKPKRSVGRPRKIVKEEPTTVKRGRGRPKKETTIQEINKRLSEEEEKLNQMRTSLNQDLQTAMDGIDNIDDKMAKRDRLIKEIESLQQEAQQVISKNEPESKIEEINKKLEKLLEEIKKLN